MFRLQNSKGRKCTNSKGSEFRTVFCLPIEGFFQTFDFTVTPFTPKENAHMKNTFKESGGRHRNVACPTHARLENYQH
jgi:hypothetical protein